MDDRWKIVAIVAAAVLIVSVVVISPYLLTPQYEPLTNGQRIVGCAPIPVGNGPVPLPLGAAPAGNTSKPPDRWFNFTFYGAPTNLSLRYIWLNLTSRSGPNLTNVAFPLGEGMEVISHRSGTWEATFDPGTGWTYQSGFGPTTPVRDGDLLSIFWSGPAPATVAGDTLTVGTPCDTTGEIIS